MNKRVKIKDVATEVGLSIASVSTVLNNKVGQKIRISPENQQKILNAAAKLGYVPNPSAQSLVSGKTRIISIFSYEVAFPFEAESEFYSFLLGIEKEAEKIAYDILILTNNKSKKTTKKDDIRLSRLKLGDGGILIGIKKHTETLLRLIDDGFPLVFIGRREIQGRDINYITFDYGPIIKTLVKYAVDMGHKKAVYLKHDSNEEPFIDRQQGLNSALEKHPIECNSKVTENNFGAEHIIKIINSGATLIFVERKSIIIKLEKVLSSMGLKPGKDISVILFEDQWFSSKTEWTCWTNERVKIGNLSVELLDSLIHSNSKKSIKKTVVPKLITGKTTCNMNLIITP